MRIGFARQWSTILALVLIALVLDWSRAAAQPRGDSGLPTGPGNPLADLQRQLDALSQRVAGLEGALTSPAAVTVDCAAGQTIAAALETVGTPLTVTVVGTCNEHVTVGRNDVTLVAGAPGAAVHGPLPTANTLTVTGDRVTIDGLTVTGGRNGITVAGGARVALRHCSVSAGRNGIAFFQGASGTVDACTLTGNGRDGISVEAASATVLRSTISANARMGVTITNGGAARLGVDNTNQLPGVPNTIANNGASGLFVTIGAQAFIGGTLISGNGTDAASSIRDGVHVFQARADLVGGNTIEDNAANGVLVVSGTVLVGDSVFGVPSGILNTITGNGTQVPNSHGVNGFLNATLDIRGAAISSNTGHGVALGLQSSARITGTTIVSNTGNGVALSNGSGLVLGGLGFANPLVQANGSGFAVGCPPAASETSVTGMLAAGSQPIGANCTGF